MSVRLNKSVLFGSLLFLVSLLGCEAQKNRAVPLDDQGSKAQYGTPIVVSPGTPLKQVNAAKPLVYVPWTDEVSSLWDPVNKLRDERKYKAALAATEALLPKFRASGQSQEVVRAYLHILGARSALNSQEKAVRHLSTVPWPSDLLSQTVLNLYMAGSYQGYLGRYFWEISQREKVVSTEAVDLKKWTKEEIYAAINDRFYRVWLQRKGLGQLDPSVIKEHLAPGDYPKEIRGTLRDTVVYEWASRVRNTGSWTPKQESSTHGLDLDNLLSKDPAVVDLSDTAVHPLSRFAALLAEHEAWHRDNGRIGAALEAFLVRVQGLYFTLKTQQERDRIRAHLRARLDTEKQQPWWTTGMAKLAGFAQQSGQPNAVLEAYKIAMECIQLHEGTKGHEQCSALAHNLKLPEWKIESMRTDNTKRASIRLQYKNMSKIHFSAWKIDYTDLVLKPHRLGRRHSHRIWMPYVKKKLVGTEPSHRWSATLSETKDLKMHTHYVTPPFSERGDYIVVAHEGDRPDGENSKAIHLNLSNLVLSVKTKFWTPTKDLRRGVREYYVNFGDTGRAVPNARIRFYATQRNRPTSPTLVKTTYTDERGFTSVKSADFIGRSALFAIADLNGKEQTVTERFYLGNSHPSNQPEFGAYIFTDRSVYRPGQTVHWQVLSYKGSNQTLRFEVQPNQKLKVQLRDANHQVVTQIDGQTNEFGTLAGKFTIPKGRILGGWSVSVPRRSRNKHVQTIGGKIQVEAYKRPTFEASFLPNPTPARLNTETTVKGEARYYFGLPVTAGTVAWRVERTPNFPWWWRWFGGQTDAETIATGTSVLNDDGQFTFKFTPSADERYLKDKGRSVTYRYKISADITDEGGETRSASRSIHLGFVAIRTALESSAAFERTGRSITLSATRSDLDGSPAKGDGSWQLYRLAQPKETPLPADIPTQAPLTLNPYALPDDRVRPRFSHGYSGHNELVSLWKDGQQVKSGTVSHPENGLGSIQLGNLPAGAYRVRYQSKDPYGATYETHREIIVVGQKTPLAVPVAFVAERGAVKVGETLRLFVHSGFNGQKVFLTQRRQKKTDQRREITGSALVEIPVEASDRGGMAFSLQFLRDHQAVDIPIRIAVPWDNKALDVRFSTFRDTLRPGQKETWSVHVKSSKGTPAVGEVLTYMYDRSLDIFRSHNPPNPLHKYQPSRLHLGRWSRSLGRTSSFHLGQKTHLAMPIPADHAPGGLLFMGGHGVGGLGFRGRGMGGGANRMSYMMDFSPEVDATAIEFEGATIDGGEPLGVTHAAPRGKAKRKQAKRTQAKSVEKFAAEDNLQRSSTTDGQAKLRSNFAETAFFAPQLTLDKDGKAQITFTVPDSVTSWNVYAHAITKDLSYGVVQKQVRTVKDLMVRPYLPRFLREGDQAVLQVVVNNASDGSLDGKVDLDIIDPETKVSRLADFGLTKAQTSGLSFKADKNKSARLSFPVQTPADLGMVAIKVTASTGQFSDGELRPIPLLPGRMHLAQSRFVVLRDVVKKTVRFDDLAKNDDETLINDSMVVTLDGQLFYGVLSALPYLVNYPYECTEQTLNRFLSTGILSSMYADYPAVARMAKKLAKRSTKWERFDGDDPNRKIALEETPWLQESRGGGSEMLLKVLDPKVASAQRKSALAKLAKAQLPSGAFPWFPGGQDSPHMTLYLMQGFAKAIEFGVDVPKDISVKAWRYLHGYINREVNTCMAKKGCWHLPTHLNYLLSMYPDSSWYAGAVSDELRQRMLAHSFKHWKTHSPYMKAYLALTLHRMDRSDDAKLVWASVMDSATETENEGTYWAPEDRSWLWYNDTIESHAMAIRTTMEITPDDPKLDGMVLWLFLNKKLNHWKSTRATSEVIYALSYYLKKTGQMGTKEETTVTVGDIEKTYVFEPDEFSGKKNQFVVAGKDIRPEKHADITFDKKTKGYQLASATWHFSTDKLPAEARGDFLSVTRAYFRREKKGDQYTLHPLAEGSTVAIGDEVEVQLSISSKHALEYVHLRDPRGAGFEPSSSRSSHKWDLGIRWYQEVRDSGTNFFFEWLPAGQYTFKYRIRATTEGAFKTGPALIQPVYAPEFVAYSAGHRLEVKPKP